MEEKCTGQATKTNKECCAIKNETLCMRIKYMHEVIYTIQNELGRQFNLQTVR